MKNTETVLGHLRFVKLKKSLEAGPINVAKWHYLHLLMKFVLVGEELSLRGRYRSDSPFPTNGNVLAVHVSNLPHRSDSLSQPKKDPREIF